MQLVYMPAGWPETSPEQPPPPETSFDLLSFSAGFSIPGHGWQQIHVQPILLSGTRTILAWEVLLRAYDPAQNCTPDHARHLQAIPSNQIDAHLLRALAAVSRETWLRHLGSAALTINIGLRNLARGHQGKRNRNRIRILQRRLPGDLLVELNEQSYLRATRQDMKILRDLRRHGVRFLLDDVSARHAPRQIRLLLDLIDGYKIDLSEPGPRREVLRLLVPSGYRWRVSERGRRWGYAQRQCNREAARPLQDARPRERGKRDESGTTTDKAIR